MGAGKRGDEGMEEIKYQNNERCFALQCVKNCFGCAVVWCESDMQSFEYYCSFLVKLPVQCLS